MDNAFELLEPQEAQLYLRRFPRETQRKGEVCFRKGCVLDVVPEEPGVSYSSLVRDGEEHEVYLECQPAEGWSGRCTCPQEFDCEHVFAAMSALLAEHRTAVVRNLSSGWQGQATALRSATSKTEAPDSTDLSQRLTAAVGRSLTKEETKFLKQVRTVYGHCAQRRQITYWNFQEMGLPLFGNDWNPLKIWPAFPNNEYEFWLYVANATQERGLKIPDFMLPISDVGQIQERLARWQRACEIERWKQTLANLQMRFPPVQRVEGEIDLRVVITRQEVRLQWRRSSLTDFEPLKQNHSRQLMSDYGHGTVQMTPEAELIWQFFSKFLNYRLKIDWSYMDAESTQMLSRLLRTRLLDSRTVADDGRPLERASEPLRWELLAATGEQDDYRLRLVQADGAPPPPILCTLPGKPPLYVTEHAIFAGPEAQPNVLESTQENRIPAPALERASGVVFLQSLGLEMPPRIRERVRTLSYEIAITCSLRATFPGSDSEECLVNVLAEAPDGRQQTWTGYNWTNSRPEISTGKPSAKARITVYDSSRLAQVVALVEPLNLKPAMYNGGGLAARVTKKFPEMFAAWIKTLPAYITLQLKDDLASFMTGDVAGRVKLEVTEAEIDWFDLRVVLDVGDTNLTPQEIRLLLNAKGRYVRLKGKGWRRLQFDLSEEENDRLARLGVSPREMSAEPQRLHALQLADEAAKKFLPEQQVEQIQRRVSELKARVVPDLPGGVTAQLRPYQLEGFHFLAYLATNRFGGVLADDMGLGKTLQTLAWLLWLREQKISRDVEAQAGLSKSGQSMSLAEAPSLVVCPKSVMDNWHAEAVRFTPGLRVKIWSANELPALREQLASADLHVLNYSQLRLMGESLVPVRWLALILDEGQYIKNPNSQTAQVARALKAEHRLILSGTPIENRLLDLWSLMSFSMPGVLGSRAQFGRLYDAKEDPFTRRRLAARVRPFVLRRTKGQVAKDLPDRIEEDLFCEIEGEQRTLYRAELKRAQQLLLQIQTQKELAQQQFHFLTSLLRLRQICCHPRLIHPDSSAPSAKTESLLEQLEPLMDEGQKVLVFSQFVEMLDLLRPELEKRQWKVFYLAGHTENRGELVRQFQSDDGPAVFLISLKAGGFGLNLTAASYVVLFDPWWNPAVENQAIDRTHRIGQVNKVIAYRLLIKNSIEEKIRELQKQKKALAEDVLGEEKFSQSLTLDDLRFLFAD
jgi:hypothetical protein